MFSLSGQWWAAGDGDGDVGCGVVRGAHRLRIATLSRRGSGVSWLFGAQQGLAAAQASTSELWHGRVGPTSLGRRRPSERCRPSCNSWRQWACDGCFHPHQHFPCLHLLPLVFAPGVRIWLACCAGPCFAPLARLRWVVVGVPLTASSECPGLPACVHRRRSVVLCCGALFVLHLLAPPQKVQCGRMGEGGARGTWGTSGLARSGTAADRPTEVVAPSAEAHDSGGMATYSRGAKRAGAAS